MTAAQSDAFRRIRQRASLMTEEAQRTLLWAQAAGDEKTVVLAAAVVDGLKRLHDHTAGIVEQGEGED